MSKYFDKCLATKLNETKRNEMKEIKAGEQDKRKYCTA